MNVPNIGNLIESDAFRDAIHVAVAPVVAGTMLEPGEHVGIVNGQVAYPRDADAIGIVDPFLKDIVLTRQRFWLFLYPGTITSLRHVWTHPMFIHRPKEQP